MRPTAAALLSHPGKKEPPGSATADFALKV